MKMFSFNKSSIVEQNIFNVPIRGWRECTCSWSIQRKPLIADVEISVPVCIALYWAVPFFYESVGKMLNCGH